MKESVDNMIAAAPNGVQGNKSQSGSAPIAAAGGGGAGAATKSPTPRAGLGAPARGSVDTTAAMPATTQSTPSSQSPAGSTTGKPSAKEPAAAATPAAAAAPAAVAAPANAAKVRALETAVGHIEKTFGKGSIMRFVGDNLPDIQGISTGALSLDIALGGKGLPKGRIVEIFGPESSGKTTLALTVIANAQKGGGNAAFIDAEHALDPSWAKRLGVKLEDMLISLSLIHI